MNFLNKQASNLRGRKFWSECPFWVALSLGPLYWCLLFMSGATLRSGEVAWRSFLILAIVYPVLEEYVFRGGVQAALYRQTGFDRSVFGISLANITTSVVFAALHLFNQPILWAMQIFMPSLIFGWMRDRYTTIRPCIILHIAYNAGFLLLFSDVVSVTGS